MKTLIVGVGNTILTDDGVGIFVAKGVKKQFPLADIIESSLSGISFLDEVAGYDRVIIIDSIKTENGIPGKVYKMDLGDISNFIPSYTHGINLRVAIELGKSLGYKLPEVIEVYAIEVKDNFTFSESFTPEIENSIPGIITQIAKASETVLR